MGITAMIAEIPPGILPRRVVGFLAVYRPSNAEPEIDEMQRMRWNERVLPGSPGGHLARQLCLVGRASCLSVTTFFQWNKEGSE